jgi:D-ribose pyranase
MLEIGILNSKIASLLARAGHMDEIIVCDAGFPIPMEVETIDLAIKENHPTVQEVLEVLLKYFSVEKIVMADEMKQHSPSHFNHMVDLFGPKVALETMPHTAFKERSHRVKGIIRTGDFTAYGNILLVSGSGDRWFVEKE